MTTEFDYDLFVIGAGSGGVRAARMAASKGKKVAVAEERYLGGTCVNVGCVPKKLFVYASQFPESFHASKGYGWSGAEAPTLDWAVLRDNKTAEIERLNGIYNNMINNSGADLFDGRATVTAPHQVEVNGKGYSAKVILVATGGWPYIPEFPRSDLAISSNEMFFLDELPTDTGISVVLDNGSSLDAGLALYATGRQANTAGLGLETTNTVLRPNGSIVVDDTFATGDPSIYALGDVIDRVQLTPVAIQEAMVLVDHLYGDGIARIDYGDIPTAVFCQPELGTVGLGEEQARTEYTDIDVYVSDFKPMLQTLGGGNDRITMKLVVDSASDRVVGCHMVGEHAAEIIQGMGIALKAGATKAHFDATVGIHPSAAEEFVTMREKAR